MGGLEIMPIETACAKCCKDSCGSEVMKELSPRVSKWSIISWEPYFKISLSDGTRVSGSRNIKVCTVWETFTNAGNKPLAEFLSLTPILKVPGARFVLMIPH